MISSSRLNTTKLINPELDIVVGKTLPTRSKPNYFRPQHKKIDTNSRKWKFLSTEAIEGKKLPSEHGQPKLTKKDLFLAWQSASTNFGLPPAATVRSATQYTTAKDSSLTDLNFSYQPANEYYEQVKNEYLPIMTVSPVLLCFKR